MDGSGDLLMSQIPYLKSRFDIRCLAIPPDDLTPWSGLTQQTVDLIRKQGSSPVYLCGESFGACLAMLVAAQVPDLIHRLILINPASSFHGNPWLQWIATITPLVSAYLYRASTLAMLPLLISLNRVDRANQQALLFAMRRVTQQTAAWRLALLSHFRAESLSLSKFTRPSLILAGQADRLLPSVDEARRLADYLPRAKTHLLPYSGHACLLETDINLCRILEIHGLLPTALLPSTGPKG
ncbi:alpha/beta hydrolase [filamentous cyanobacterium CCP5]|nr:alpha/beta hydrolase [filamentous cyanobacterium CCP5]